MSSMRMRSPTAAKKNPWSKWMCFLTVMAHIRTEKRLQFSGYTTGSMTEAGVNGKILMNFYWRGKKHSCYVQNFDARCGWSCRCIYTAQSGRENRDDKGRRNQAMSEKMLVTQALDERDLLVKKIGDKIRFLFHDVISLEE